MSRVSDPDLLVLLTLRLRTLADLDSVTAATGLPADSAAEGLSALEQRGWVRHREGRVEGWMLTPDGREACAAQLAAELDAAAARDDVSAAYQRFLSVNQPLLDLCTDWQLREAGSAEATTRGWCSALDDVDAVAQSVCRDLASVLGRFDGYGAEAVRRPGVGRRRRDRLVDRSHHRLVPHGLVRAAREPARDPRARAGRRGREPASDPSSLQEAR